MQVVLRIFIPPSMMASGIHSAAARPPNIVLPQPRRVQVAVRRAVQTQISWLATLEFPAVHGIPLVGREVSPVSSGRAADLSLIGALALADGAGTAVGEATVGVAAGEGGGGGWGGWGGGRSWRGLGILGLWFRMAILGLGLGTRLESLLV